MGWLLVLVATVLTGERMSSWGEVRDLVTSGRVHAVEVSQELSTLDTGYATVEVRWRRGPWTYTAEVVHARGPEVPEARSFDVPVLRVAPSSRLLALQPSLEVTRTEADRSGGRLAGWRVSTPLALGALILLVLCLAMVVSGPRPWYATRWAWFWLLLPPFGTIAFILLAGPTPGLRRVVRPPPEDQRLTGGWAFLLAIPLASLLGLRP